jgi:hypothetical protein
MEIPFLLFGFSGGLSQKHFFWNQPTKTQISFQFFWRNFRRKTEKTVEDIFLSKKKNSFKKVFLKKIKIPNCIFYFSGGLSQKHFFWNRINWTNRPQKRLPGGRQNVADFHVDQNTNENIKKEK